MKVIYYFPWLHHIIGSVWGVLLLVRTCYFYKIKKGNPFYKFFNPCEHYLYQFGDSWSEELGCTKNVLGTTFKKCATKIKKGQSYNLLECEWVLFYSGGNGMTYFLPNYPKMLTLDIPDEILKSYFPHFLEWKIRNPNAEKWNCKIQIFNIQNSNFGHPYKQESTQVKTQLITQEKDFPGLEIEISNDSDLEKEKSSAQKEKVILPFESSGFRKVWEAWKSYRAKRNKKIYTTEAEMAALFPLGNYTEEFSINLITKAISNEWKDFHFEDSPLKFKKITHDKRNSTSGEFEPHVADLLR